MEAGQHTYLVAKVRRTDLASTGWRARRERSCVLRLEVHEHLTLVNYNITLLLCIVHGLFDPT